MTMDVQGSLRFKSAFLPLLECRSSALICKYGCAINTEYNQNCGSQSLNVCSLQAGNAFLAGDKIIDAEAHHK